MKMKRLYIMITAIFMAFALVGCGKKSKQETSEMPELMMLNEDGTYTPKEGDFYIGAAFNYVGAELLAIDLICKDGLVVDCGNSGGISGEFRKEDYIGLSYMEAVEKYYETFGAERNIKDADEIIISVTPDMDNDRDPIREEFQKLAEKIGFPPNKINFASDPKERFNEKIAAFTEDAVRKQAQDGGQDEGQGGGKESEIPTLLEAASFDELKKGYEAGCREFVLTGDVNIDLNQCDLYDSIIECGGHSVTVSGVIRYREGVGAVEVRFENPGAVDLSAVSVDEDSFESKDTVRQSWGLTFHGGDYKNLKMPSGIYSREDKVDFVPFEGHAWIDINDDGTDFFLGFAGPNVSYDELHEKEIQIMTAILTEGDAEGLETQNNMMFWTKMEIDVGDVTLPDQDYWGFKLMPGASLKISGKITITGGRFGWNISEGDQLDIRDLTLVKKHASPDMVKISFDSSVVINEELLQAKAGSGKIMFDKSADSYNITIW